MNGTLTTPSGASVTLLRVTHVVYGLHALGLALGAFGAASLLGSFLFGWPSIIAVILNYVYRGEARGTWLESHFTWQIRTFWFSLLWAVIGFATIIVGIGFLVLAADSIWVIYRIVKGFLNWNDGKPMAV